MGWGIFMFCGFTARAVFGHDLIRSLVLTILMEPMGLALSCGLRWIYQRARLKGGLTLRNVLVVAVSSSVMALIEMIWNVALDWFAGGALGTRLSALPLRFEFYLGTFVAWSAAYVWLKAEHRSRAEQEMAMEADQAAQRAELQMLRMQLDPHFMFNALNNIATEILQRPKVAHEMTCRLANYLRYSFERREEWIVPLAQEVEAMANYLAIEEERFGGNLGVSIEIDPNAGFVEVPSFLLQPLVENAVKHGLGSSSPPWRLAVKVWRERDQIWIQVRNPGLLHSDKEHPNHTGTGLANVRRRLELHFPARHRFELREQDGYVCSEIVLEGSPCIA
jgi:two-component system, LytTR family, sensor kinase